MKTVRAAVIPQPDQPVEIREIPLPALEPNSALLRVELSEVCGTDVHLAHGLLDGVPYPLIPGHVAVGILESIRGEVRDVDGRPFSEGDRVTFLDVHDTCNACWHCLVAKASTRCPHRRVYGITYGVEDGPSGGWCETIYLKPGTRVIGLTGVAPERFMAGGCSLPTALHAVERGDVRIGDTVLVLGSGPVGLSSIILARMSGAAEVLCVGAPDRRLRQAEMVGAGATLDFQSCSPAQAVDWVRDRTGGRGADVTIEATGAPDAVVGAMRSTRDAGVVVMVGQYTNRGETAFNPHLDLNAKHLDVRGCWGSDFSHFHQAAQLMRREQHGELWSRLQLKTFPLSQVGEALAQVASARVVKALVDPSA